jgi:hypothetical protein
VTNGQKHTLPWKWKKVFVNRNRSAAQFDLDEQS